jgi:catechol 2,3-dioxygenase-like lactoylglutathione lyase family enzyme
MATAIGVGMIAQGAATGALPLANLGLEHLDIIVPDPAASARFYTRIFKSALHQQPVRDSLRHLVLPGDLPADRGVRPVHARGRRDGRRGTRRRRHGPVLHQPHRHAAECRSPRDPAQRHDGDTAGGRQWHVMKFTWVAEPSPTQTGEIVMIGPIR